MTPSLPILSKTSAMRSPISWIRGADGRDLGDLVVALDRDRGRLDGLRQRLLGRVDADLHLHRVGARGDVLQALGDDRLGEHRRGRRAVAGDVLGLGRGFLEQLRAHVLERVVELDVARHRDAVMGDRRARRTSCRAPTLRPLGPRVALTASASASMPRFSAPAGVLVVGDELGHADRLSSVDRWGPPGPWMRSVPAADEVGPRRVARLVIADRLALSKGER